MKERRLFSTKKGGEDFLDPFFPKPRIWPTVNFDCSLRVKRVKEANYDSDILLQVNWIL